MGLIYIYIKPMPIYHYYLTGNIVDLITLCEHIYHTHTQIHTKAHTHEYFTISSLKTDVKKKKKLLTFVQ